MPKRILILTAGFGEGHNSAARGIAAGLAAIAPEAAAVERHDLFAETYGVVNDWARRVYLTLINRAPRSLVADSTTGSTGDEMRAAENDLRFFFGSRID